MFWSRIAPGAPHFSPPSRPVANPRSVPHLAATGRRYIDLAAMSHPAPLLPQPDASRVTSAILFAPISRRPTLVGVCGCAVHNMWLQEGKGLIMNLADGDITWTI